MSQWVFLFGAAGVGKTTIVARLILLQMAAGHQVGVFTASNVAATNAARRTQECMTNSEVFLIIRPWATYLEEDAALRYAHSQDDSWRVHRRNPFRGLQLWEPELSAAEWILKLAGAIPTINPVIIRLKLRHEILIKALNTSEESRGHEVEERLRSLIRKADKDIAINANGCCGTTTSSKSPWTRKLVKRAGCIVVDEAVAAVPSEVLIRSEAPSASSWLAITNNCSCCSLCSRFLPK
jgi:hypothetical protein